MWAELQRALRSGAVIAYGAAPAWAAWLAAQLAKQELVVVVARDDVHMRELADDIGFFIGGDDIALLPGIDVSPYADLAPDRSCIVERVATLYRLTRPELRPKLV